MAKDDFKTVTINNRTFLIRKFDALTGSYTMMKVGGIFASLFNRVDPKLLKVMMNKDKEENKDSTDKLSIDLLKNIDITGIASSLLKLSEEDYLYIQNKCLQVCFESLPAGPAQVLNNNGSIGIIDFDAKLAMALTAHALTFNVTDFFGGNLLDSILGGLISTQQS